MVKQKPVLLSLLAWAIIWEFAARYAANDMFPPLSGVVQTAFELTGLQSFKKALVITARAFAIGMLLSILVGIPVGALMGRFKPVDRILNVWVNIFISAPLTAVVPALMPILGIGEVTVVATVFLFAVWVIIIDTREGMVGINRSLIEMARSLGASRWEMFSKIMLPAAMPEVMTGLRLSVVRGIKGVIIGQIVVSVVGFGELFDSYLHSFEMARFWALVMIVFLLGMVMMGIVGMAERRLTRHARVR